MNGVLIIEKPAGLTSHDVVNRARRILQQRSVGHLGTLDPSATGVLPLVTGSLTRLAQFYTSSQKCYEGSVRFGFSTDTYDAEGEPTSELQAVTLDPARVEEVVSKFRGAIEQTPPPYSAKKINGVPAYKLARKQQAVVLKAVQVEIKEFTVLSIEGDRLQFRATVSSGTYMRCVAHDMGKLLGCGAHLESLRRTAVAEFTIANAHTLDEVAEAAGKGSVEDLFLHPRTLLPDFPSVTADEANAAFIRSGRTVNLPDFSRARLVKVFSGQKDLIAIASRVAGTLFHPKIVFVTDAQPEAVGRR